MRQNERGIRFIRVGGAVAASTAVGLPDNQGEPTLKVVLSLVHFYSQGTRSEMGSCQESLEKAWIQGAGDLWSILIICHT